MKRSSAEVAVLASAIAVNRQCSTNERSVRRSIQRFGVENMNAGERWQSSPMPTVSSSCMRSTNAAVSEELAYRLESRQTAMRFATACSSEDSGETCPYHSFFSRSAGISKPSRWHAAAISSSTNGARPIETGAASSAVLRAEPFPASSESSLSSRRVFSLYRPTRCQVGS